MDDVIRPPRLALGVRYWMRGWPWSTVRGIGSRCCRRIAREAMQTSDVLVFARRQRGSGQSRQFGLGSLYSLVCIEKKWLRVCIRRHCPLAAHWRLPRVSHDAPRQAGWEERRIHAHGVPKTTRHLLGSRGILMRPRGICCPICLAGEQKRIGGGD